MMVPGSVLALGSLFALASCGGQRSPEPGPVSPTVIATAPIDAGTGSPPATDASIPVAPIASSSGGVPHLARIVAAAVARHADAALSIDATGEVRLWTALDGSAPPRRVAVTGLLDPRVERAGADVVVGAVLAGGVGYLGRHHVDGAPPTDTILDGVDGDVIAVVPTTDARAVVVARADQALELYDVDGTRRARLELGRERLRGLVALGPSAVLAVVRRADDHFVARRYDARAGTLTAGIDVELPHEPLDGRPLAISPDGARLATLRAVVAPAPAPPTTPPGPGKPRPPDRLPEPPPAPPAITVQIVDLATGADVTPPALLDHVLDNPARLGFSSADLFRVNDGDGGIVTAPATGAGPLTTATAPGLGLLAVGDGVVVGADGASLAVTRGDRPTVFLGYRVAMPRSFALSPDGHQLAVASFDQTVAVEALDGSAPEHVFELSGARTIFVGFLDERRLIVVDDDHHASVRDATTGAEQAAITVPDGATIALHPRRSWLFGLRERGGLWAVPLAGAGPAPFGPPITIDDGGRFLAVVDDGRADGPVVATLADDRVRSYTPADLAGAAHSKRKRAPGPRVPSSGPADELGHFYASRGPEVVATDLAGVTTIIPLATVAEAMVPVPGGGVLVGAAASGGFVAYGLDGKPRWSLAIGGVLSGTAASADRAVLALSTQGGILIVDAASGAPRHASCGWGFGAWPSPPPELASSPFVLCR